MLVNSYIDQPITVLPTGALSTQERRLLTGTGSASLPSFGFLSEPSTGWYRIGAGNIAAAMSGVKNVDFAPTLYQFTNASGASNSTLRIENTDNTGATASHAIMEMKVGGATQTGSPQARWSTPGGTVTGWVAGADRGNSDAWTLATGTSFASGTTVVVIFGGSGAANGAAIGNGLVTLVAGQGLRVMYDFGDAQGTIGLRPRVFTSATVNTGSTFEGIGAIYGLGGNSERVTNTANWTAAVGVRGISSAFSTGGAASGTVTGVASFYAYDGVKGGLTVTNQYGLYIEPLTAGTNNYGVYVNTPTGTIAESIHTTGGILNSQGAIQIGGAANTTANQFWTASQGAATTDMYIGNGKITVVSDVRLKQDIRNSVINARSVLGRLRVVDYTWADPSEAGNPDHNRASRGRWTGLLAQEVAPVLPWIVNAVDITCRRCLSGQRCTKEDGHGHSHTSMWALDLVYMTGVFVRGFQESYARMDDLERRVSVLEKR